MSIEKQVRKARRAMVFWRFVGDLIAAPRILLRAVAEVLHSFETTIFYYELDAARRYKALTGTDLGVASGNAARYTGLDPELAEEHRKEALGYFRSDDDDED